MRNQVYRLGCAMAAWIGAGLVGSAVAQERPSVESLLSKAKLIQEIDCAAENEDLLFLDYPSGASRVETILGTPCRMLDNKQPGAKFFAYRIGEDKGLKPGRPYFLTMEYPEDTSRTIWVCNWGCETALGFATGRAVGDVLRGRYVPSNPESLDYPLSGEFETWSQLFYLHDRFPEIQRPRGLFVRPLVPENGFWVVVAQPPPFQDPLSAGAAVSKIRLYEVTDPDALAMPIHFPPDDLPRRHIFSREEMSDNAVVTGHKPEEKDPKFRGVEEIADWHEYKMLVMKFLGINTFAKDLLEFGHNQGWDSGPGGGNDWVYQSSTPDLWEQILERAAKHDLTVLPYYEYRGSIGGDKSLALGPRMLCRRLDGGDRYTDIAWCEGNNADITLEETIADAKKLLDISMLRYKDRVDFIGAWFRNRPTAMPMSFSETNLRAFSAEANGGKRITRAHLQTDKELLGRYYDWWFGKRVAFFTALRDHLRSGLGDQDAFILYTNDTSEPGRSLPRSITGAGRPNGWEWMQVVVNDDMDTWSSILSDQEKYPYIKPYAFEEVVEQDMHLRGLQTFVENYGTQDNAHSTPPDDPQNYQGVDGVMLSYTYNRLYTVSSPRPFDAYRTASGLAIMRHYSLNEHEMDADGQTPLGYFIIDVERAGPYCMMAEARAMAYGDPTLLGSLTGNSNHRGFPQYVRNFHANFLALPALPSELVPNASDDPEVFVRQTPTKHGTYLAVVNTGFQSKQDLSIKLPVAGRLLDATTGEPVATENQALSISLYPAQLRSFLIEPADAGS